MCARCSDPVKLSSLHSTFAVYCEFCTLQVTLLLLLLHIAYVL